MAQQVKSKKRVQDHGEVFTAEREVNAMLDLVKTETQRIDSRFLEPACGDGNFLVEVLKRKLEVVVAKYKKFPSDFEKYSLLALTSMYGVDILTDNAIHCRERLFAIWETACKKYCKTELHADAIKSAKYILEKNIVCGNALSMKSVDEHQQDTDVPIIFPEWSFVTGAIIKRRDFRFDVLLEEHGDDDSYAKQYSLFDDEPTCGDYWMIDPVTNETIPKPVKEFEPIHYRRIWEHD